MATARVAVGAVLDSVTNVATSIGTLATVATKSVGMLDAAVTKAASNQRKSHHRDALLFDQRLLSEYAHEASSIQLHADDFCDKSDRHKQLFEQNYNQLSMLINPSSQALVA